METALKPKKEFPVIEIPASGKPDWYGGAWCLVWVYSTEGNFLLKGFRQECADYIKEKGWKCWAIFNLYHSKKDGLWSTGKKYRTIIETFKCGFDVYSPSPIRVSSRRRNSRKRRVKPADFKYAIRINGEKENHFIKRLPQVFVDFKF
ncbi:MAG: hypothetical protein AABY15_02240 [Nanoarchaeota archaeon]